MFVSRWFGRDTSNVSTAYLLCLGIGATLAVALHAAVAVLRRGARCGLPLWPSFKWKHPAVRALARRMVPAAGTATLDAGWLFILIVAAGTVPGGVVAIQIGINFYYMPVALEREGGGHGAAPPPFPRGAPRQARSSSARPTTSASRGRGSSRFPRRSRCWSRRKPIAQAIAFGEMRTADGIALLSASIGGLGLALIGADDVRVREADVLRAPRRDRSARSGARRWSRCSSSARRSPHVELHGPRCSSGSACSSPSASWRGRSSPTAPRAGARTRQTGTRVQSLLRHVGIAAVTIVPGASLGRVVQDELGGHIGALSASRWASASACRLRRVQSFLGAPELPPAIVSDRTRVAAVPGTEGTA